MTIVIIDDNLTKIRYVVEELKRINSEYDYMAFETLESATSYLDCNEVDGIVTDMEYPLRENEPNDSQAGNSLLQWLCLHKKRIPVLGNSFGYTNFNEGIDYPFYKKMMAGLVPKIFQEFISQIKDHD